MKFDYTNNSKERLIQLLLCQIPLGVKHSDVEIQEHLHRVYGIVIELPDLRDGLYYLTIELPILDRTWGTGIIRYWRKGE